MAGHIRALFWSSALYYMGKEYPIGALWSPIEDRVGDSLSEGQRMSLPKMGLNSASFRASTADILSNAVRELWGWGEGDINELDSNVVCLLHSIDYVLEMRGGAERPALTAHHTTSILFWPVYISTLQSCSGPHL